MRLDFTSVAFSNVRVFIVKVEVDRSFAETPKAHVGLISRLISREHADITILTFLSSFLFAPFRSRQWDVARASRFLVELWGVIIYIVNIDEE